MVKKYIVFISLFLVCCTKSDYPKSPTTIEPVVNQLFDSPEYGIHLSQWWHVNDMLPQNLDLVKEMNFGWVKHKFAWRDIEGYAKGEYNWYHPDRIVEQVEEAGLKLIVRLDRQPLWSVEGHLPDEEITENQPPFNYADFGDFCYAVANRYQGRVDAYQVWNEPNLSREWGNVAPSPEDYTRLLRICYENIKKADPNAIVVSAGLAPTGTPPPNAIPDTEFLQAMYDAGAGEYFDMLGVNAPGYKAPPEISPEEAAKPSSGWGEGRWFVFRHVEDIRQIMVMNGDARKQIFILEMGWTLDEIHPQYAWHRVTSQEQADYLVRAYQYAKENWQPWIGPMITIYFADNDWTSENEQWWWSIVLPDGTPREAYYALRDMPK